MQQLVGTHLHHRTLFARPAAASHAAHRWSPYLQAPEPLWLAQQLVGTHLRNEARPLYSYGISDVLRSLSGPGDEQEQRPVVPQQGQQQGWGRGAKQQQPVQLVGRCCIARCAPQWPTPLEPQQRMKNKQWALDGTAGADDGMP